MVCAMLMEGTEFSSREQVKIFPHHAGVAFWMKLRLIYMFLDTENRIQQRMELGTWRVPQATCHQRTPREPACVAHALPVLHSVQAPSICLSDAPLNACVYTTE